MSKRKTQTQWSPDATPNDLVGVGEDDAPAPTPEAAPSNVEGEDADSPPPTRDPPPAPPVWRELPVASVLPPVAALAPPPSPSPLEDRLHRLEAELARLRANPSPSEPGLSVVRQPGSFWGGVGKSLLAPSGPAAALPPTPKPDSLASMIPPGVRRTWILFDALRELRAMYCMYFDPRYRLSWLGRLVPLAIMLLILTSNVWMPGTGLPWPLGLIIDKAADLILAYFLVKLLSHEARRYRETAPDLPPSLRL